MRGANVCHRSGLNGKDGDEEGAKIHGFGSPSF